MRRQPPLVGTILAVLILWLSGCRPQQPRFLFEDGDLSHYIGEATQIEYPDARVESLDEVEVDGQNRPMTLQFPEAAQIWDLSLEEAVHIALANNRTMRMLTRPLGDVQDYLTSAPDQVLSTYYPALLETNPVSGPEAALSAFDAQLKGSLLWEKIDNPRNIATNPLVEAIFPSVDEQDLGTFATEISKTNVTGGTTTLRHNVRYNWSNSPTRAFPSDWYTNIEAEFRQPLLQGAGVQFNRIAGPGATPGINNGVILARINTDIGLADFEAGVRNLVNDVERAYWQLFLEYHRLDTARKARDYALKTWKTIYVFYQEGDKRGDAASESQVREQYFRFQAAVQAQLNALYSVEANLRYMMGIAATDGRLIRPSDEATTAKIDFPWLEIHYEAQARSVDLRRQRWVVKKREMELIAAKNYLLPRLDAVGRYRWLGLGDDLIYSKREPDSRATAWQNLTSGRYQEWEFGLEMSLPIGFRREMAGVRHSQLALARDRSLLQDQELEVSHQIAQAIRDLEGSYELTETGFSRMEAARYNVEKLQIKYDLGALEINVLLDAQQKMAVAEAEYYQALWGYALSIAQVHFRKGSLLEYNGVYLAEGPWPAKAYFDATRLARARDAALYMDYGYTRPKVVSRGPYEQHIGTSKGTVEPSGDGTTPEAGKGAGPEPIPAGDVSPMKKSSAPQSGSSAWNTKGSHDLGSGLGALAAKSATASQVPAVAMDGVRPASYQQPASGAWQGDQAVRQAGGRISDLGNESVENPPSGQADRSSSGWRKAQY